MRSICLMLSIVTNHELNNHNNFAHFVQKPQVVQQRQTKMTRRMIKLKALDNIYQIQCQSPKLVLASGFTLSTSFKKSNKLFLNCVWFRIELLNMAVG
ncbi:hypothetical protein BpHYR1_052258 [Brachionus plicatilis]|uniref:Uncharacterized protein n=1 Tax=Brachionus plicatilis TaxID=10195 RepID=A0A3M7TAE9_BRAPC|nr:hypothetical protein BpHYR1_052258 [Brachionus plicatilis]